MRSAGRRAIMPARSIYGGYCYLNNAALAAQYLRDHGCARVAVLDVDYHHGNGTQEIFWERDDVLFVSLHASTRDRVSVFPGLCGRARRGRRRGLHAEPAAAARHGLAGIPRRARHSRFEAIGRYAPEALVVSLGVDTFEADPISAFKLAARHYPRIGACLAARGLPTVLVQEGGYAVAEIGANVAGVLGAFAGP